MFSFKRRQTSESKDKKQVQGTSLMVGRQVEDARMQREAAKACLFNCDMS